MYVLHFYKHSKSERCLHPHSLGGPAIFHPSILPTFVKKANVPSPRHADVPVIALWAVWMHTKVGTHRHTHRHKQYIASVS